MAMKLLKAVVDCSDGVPKFLRLQGPVDINPIAIEAHGETDFQILLFGDQNRPEGPIEFILIGTNQDFPDMSEFPDLDGAKQYGFQYVGVAARRVDPDGFFCLYHVQHVSKLEIARELPPLPGHNGGARRRRG